MELVDRLKKVRNMIDELEDIPQKISIKSGTELFLRFTTLRVQNILHSESDIGKIKKELGICCKNKRFWNALGDSIDLLFFKMFL